MLTILEGYQFTIYIPTGVKVLIIVVAIIWCILFFLYYRFSHFRKRVYFNIATENNTGVLTTKEMEQQMQELAKNHELVKLMKYNFVLDDYNQIAYKKLNRIRNKISAISTDIITLIPAARWLFDNFQMMYREIKKVRTSGTSYEILPILRTKEYRGYPRIYIIAKKMVALSRGHLDEENISIMLAAYQKKIPLTDKELWVLPEMLGFCLLENIIDVAEEILHIIHLKSKADLFVRERLEGEKNRADIQVLLTEIEQDCKNDFSFHAHVIYLLKNMSYDDLSVQKYLEYHFPTDGKRLSPAQVFVEEGRIESLLETRIRSLIVSLREINEFNLEGFYEAFSYLEEILSKDPAGIYPKMDSESKGMYRGVIVKLAHRYKIEEQKIVNDVLELANTSWEGLYQADHVGTYLLGKGYPILKAKVSKNPIDEKATRKKSVKGTGYFLTLIFLLICIYVPLWFLLKKQQETEQTGLILLTLIVATPVFIGIGLELNNFIFTRHIKVKKIPSLDYLREIPDQARTFVVMPVIVSTMEQGMEYMDRLQKHYLANRQPNLFFALLVDYKDSPDQYSPEDEVIENALIARLNELNETYYSEHQRFSLFIRYRKWNKSENCYMGWERKRGKLEEFNNLLNGIAQDNTSFSTILTDREYMDSYRYVITLDADTNLIRDNAAKLVGLIDHPLNQPIVDEQTRKVKEGYVIIQPSVRNHIVDKKGSRFAEIFGGQSGLAHYSAVISDIYQDIFDEGIYTGKGIYDVKAFHQLLTNMIPENRVLSHDLLESCYARTAFSSTAKIMDSFPSSVISYAKREHRWIRGDWQLLPWLFRKNTVNNKRLCALSRWKIFDNLRRSLVPISKVLLIILNLALFPKQYYVWVGIVLFVDIFQFIVLVIAVTTQKLFRPKLALVSKSFFKELVMMVQRAYVELVLTPYRAYLAGDAMLRTLYRLLISKRNLLRWNTAESVDASIINTRKGYFRVMWSSLIPAVVLIILLILTKPPLIGVLLYGALSLGWIFAYQCAFSISQPKDVAKKEIDKDNRELLLDTARRTWQFFKDMSTRENNWLCPDNYQLSRAQKQSDKTSPTNIGLQLMAILSARDFGFETTGSVVCQLENVMNTIQKLLKWRGHLYNWYQIRTLEVLNPAYISTVDSGNYIGHLIALKNGLIELMDAPIITKNMVGELKKTMKLSKYEGTLRENYEKIGDLVEDLTDIWEDLGCRECLPIEDSRWCKELLSNIEHLVKEASDFKLKEVNFNQCPSLRQLEKEEIKSAKAMLLRIKDLCNRIDHILANVDFHFLFNERRCLFHIGYHTNSGTLDAGCYDLMASESALTSFLAIARGEVPLRHWQKLGRPLTMVDGIPCFVSWSGTMFEYLMPNMVMREYEDSVYAESSMAAVNQHMNYAKEAGIPWGISESQFYRFDTNSNYQYKAFGVPKLRLQPVRQNSLVVTPYATMLALDYAGAEGFANLKKLVELGGYGEYGFYEALDFSSPNSVELTPYSIVKSFMAHHQGMIIVSINNFLNEGIWKKRFHREPIVKATEVLLEEKRQSHLVSLAKRGYTIRIGKIHLREEDYSNRYVNSVAPRIPIANMLSNNKYSLMVTSDGDGFSKYKHMMLYRWRSDLYANTGNYIYIKDVQTGSYWSTAYHPTKIMPDDYQVIFAPHKAEFKRKDGSILTHTLVSLSPDHNVEVRKVTLINHGTDTKQMHLTSYIEVVGDSHMAELSHPAFNKLFIESEFIEEHGAFLSKRRGSKGGSNPYVLHMVKANGEVIKKLEYENDRLKFIGRNNTLENPDGVVNNRSFSNLSGFCNDPIMSIRATISLAPGETLHVSFITGVCESREEAIHISEEFGTTYRIDDIYEKFRLQRDIELKYLEITKYQLNAFQDLISPIYYPNALYRGPKENIRRNFQNQSFLWRFGISGDNPIMLMTVKTIEEAEMIKDVLKAYEYLRINRVGVDLILLSEAKHGYMQELDNLINDLSSSLKIYDASEEKPSLFLLHAYEMIPGEIDLLYTVARVVFSDKTGIYFKSIKEKITELVED